MLNSLWIRVSVFFFSNMFDNVVRYQKINLKLWFLSCKISEKAKKKIAKSRFLTLRPPLYRRVYRYDKNYDDWDTTIILFMYSWVLAPLVARGSSTNKNCPAKFVPSFSEDRIRTKKGEILNKNLWEQCIKCSFSKVLIKF